LPTPAAARLRLRPSHGRRLLLVRTRHVARLPARKRNFRGPTRADARRGAFRTDGRAPGVMMTTIEDLRAVGVLASLDVHFARALGRIGGEPQPEVLLAAALVSRHVSHGHVCLDLPRFVRTETVDDAGMPVERHAWPPLAPWLDALRSSPLVTAGDAIAPLVLDAAGRLYLRRYWEHQERLAPAIRGRRGLCGPVARSWP